MRMTDMHEVTYLAASESETFDLVSFLQLPTGRLRCADVRWRLTPTPPGGEVGVRVRLRSNSKPNERSSC